MQKAMIDYDVNPAEWEELKQRMKEKLKNEKSDDNISKEHQK